VAPSGAVLDPAGIYIRPAVGWDSPALGFDGGNYLVVWTGASADNGDIYGARVTPAGTVLDIRTISSATNEQCSPALVFGRKCFLVVWNDHRTGSDIYGARVTPQGAVLDSAGIIISRTSNYFGSPSLAFDGTDYLVVWEDPGSGINGARVSPEGRVFDHGSVLSLQGSQFNPRLCCGSGSQMFLAYQDWTGTIGGKSYNAERIWGMMDPNPGVAETPSAEVRMTKGGATIVRGVLHLQKATSLKPQTTSLLDISGRKVLDLKSGANDVRALAPGVYFVGEGLGTRGQGLGRIRKVVLVGRR
jgi:hypothetical protein